MANVKYTTTDAVRAVLGVTAKEIADNQMTDLLIEEQLTLKLDVLYPGHADLKAAIDDNNPPATAEQQKMWSIVKLWCQYQAAVFMLPGLQMVLAQKISDGDAEMQRFMKDNLQDTIDRILGARDEYLILLNPGIYETSGQFQHFSRVEPALDPVTDDGAGV